MQKVNCWMCDGSGKEKEWIDPYECQNCINWNVSYRSKVACHVCKDTRETPNRRHRMITCKTCKGTGRDYEQEKRNVEFGGRDYMLSSSSIISIGGLKVHEGKWRSRTQKQEWYEPKMSYKEAESVCQSLGNGWRLPNSGELNLLFKSQKSNQYNLGFDWITEYWTSSQAYMERLRFVLNDVTMPRYGSSLDIGNSTGMYAGYASCKCVNSN